MKNRALLVLAAVEEVLGDLIQEVPAIPTLKYHPDSEAQTEEYQFVIRHNAIIRAKAEQYGIQLAD